MRLKTFLWTQALTLVAFLLPGGMDLHAQAQAPHILFIAVDDLKPTLGCYGDTLAHTPHIDALAARGVTFTNAHCQQAVCAPSRVSLLTSRYPDQTRVWDLNTQMRDMDPDMVTLPQYLIGMGYRTSGTGKVFDSRSVDGNRDAPSWSVSFRNNWDPRYYSPEYGKPVQYFYASAHSRDTVAFLEAEAASQGVSDVFSYVKERYHPSVERAEVPFDAYADGAIANVGLELLEESAASGKPFFLAVGFHRPHLPFNAPGEFWDLWDRSDFSVAPFQEPSQGGPSIAYHNFSELRSYTDIPSSGPLSEDKQLELIHAYYAATAYIDSMVGLLLARLDELGLRENTLVVLWGDHGWHLGDHELWCKHSNFEQATRSPLIIAAPGLDLAGSSSSSPVEFTDIAPTLLELSGIQIPGYFEGESLLPVLEDTLARIREAALSQYPRQGKMGYTLRSERYRYTRWQNDDGSAYARELYDYEEDPLERVNLVTNPMLQDLVTHMDSLLLSRMDVPSTQHKIRFQIFSGDDGRPMEGVNVNMASEALQSDGNGLVGYTHHSGLHQVGFSAEGYLGLDTAFLIDRDTLIQVLLEAEVPSHEVEMVLKDRHSDKHLINALVALDGMEFRSDAQGQLSFRARQGWQVIQIQKTNYAPITDTLQVSRDTSLLYLMEALVASVKVRLLDGSTPVNKATVHMAGQSQETGSLGTATFSDLETGTSYAYQVEKEAYEPVEGQLSLLADTTLHIQLSKVTSFRELNALGGFRAWPNPASRELNLRIAEGTGRGSLCLLDMQGKIILKKDLDEGKHRLNLEVCPRGACVLQFTNEQMNHSSLLLIF